MSVPEATERRDWNWDEDGELDGLYVETRPVVIKNGPSAGKTKLIFDFHLSKNEDSVSVWETTVLRSKFAEELRNRRKSDFEYGERFVIRPTGMKAGVNGSYRDFDVTFEHAAPRPSTAELLEASGDPDDEPAAADVDIPFA
jgi:hypothetical protein